MDCTLRNSEEPSAIESMYVLFDGSNDSVSNPPVLRIRSTGKHNFASGYLLAEQYLSNPQDFCRDSPFHHMGLNDQVDPEEEEHPVFFTVDKPLHTSPEPTVSLATNYYGIGSASNPVYDCAGEGAELIIKFATEACQSHTTSP